MNSDQCKIFIANSKKKRNAYVTKLQKERLVDYVTSNYEALYSKKRVTRGSEPTKDYLWNVLAVELNEIGAVKDVAGWKRCFTSLKSSTIRNLKNIGNVPNILQNKIIEASYLDHTTDNSNTVASQAKCLKQKPNQKTTSHSTIGATYSTQHQRSQLIKLVGENYNALFGKLSNSSNGEEIKKKVWQAITDKINTMGPKKNVKGWMRCYASLKASTKEKLTTLRQNKNRKNSGAENIEVNPIQWDIINMHHPDTLDGCQSIDEVGFGPHAVPLKTISFDSNALEESCDPDCDEQTEVLFAQFDRKLKALQPTDDSISSNTGNEIQWERIDIDDYSGTNTLDVDTDCQNQSEEPNNLNMGSVYQIQASTNENAECARDLSKYIENQRNFLNGFDGTYADWLNFNDLNESEQINLLMSESDMPAQSLAKKTEQNINVSQGAEEETLNVSDAVCEQVDECTRRTESSDVTNRSRPKIVILQNLLLKSLNEVPPTPNFISPNQKPQNEDLQEELNVSTAVEVRRQQRRGVEINLNKYADIPLVTNETSQDKERHPRRNRLSTPLAVMAEQALAEQKKTNTLLAELLEQLRNRN